MKPGDFQLANEKDEPFDKGNEIAQIKQDGRRVAVEKIGDTINLIGRDNIVPNNYPELVAAFKQIPGDFVVDTEFAVFNNGKSDRGLLQSRDKLKDAFKIRMASNITPAKAVVFDILEYNGEDLRNVEYQERKNLLDQTLQTNQRVEIARDFSPQEAWDIAEEKQLEGIMIKNIHAPYLPTRNNNWIKVKRKEKFQAIFDGYETNPAGITLTSKTTGLRCACHGQQHVQVKQAIDEQGTAIVLCRRMANTKNREIVFYSFVGK